MVTQLFEVVPPDVALARVLSHGLPEPTIEHVPLAAATCRVVGHDIRAPEPSPAFDRSTMDGFAVRAADTYGATESMPAYLTVIGEVPMGSMPHHRVTVGVAMLIHTGGMLPEGSDAVVMIEHTQAADDGTIEVMRAAAPGDWLIRRGDDVIKGSVIAPRGTRLRAQDVGGLAALGVVHIPVAVKPMVGIVATGDEVVAKEAIPGVGEIRDVNSSTLEAEVERVGGTSRSYGVVPDDRQALLNVARMAEAECDVIVISAGSSVSTRDLTADVISAMGAPGILAHGLALKPGKPSIVALAGKTPIFGLPGNPVSALVVFDLVVGPTIRQLQGEVEARQYPLIRARLTRNLASTAGRLDFVPARLLKRDDEVWAEPIFGASNMIFTLVRADALIRVPTDANGLPAGSFVDVRMLT